ncbi:MAG: ClpXP protease specificity-enhancing factor SspB [Azospirillaceae bacterium]|nr:ClpXP protease specificity-enhancing factor SspB [Azospirillaceae bacterium]
MAQELLRYDRMVEGALRGVVREALREASEYGLPGAHHFYLTFRTGFPGVAVPEYLRAQYPGEITIVLQHQFYELEVFDDRFSVSLSFNGVPERLVVPFAAISTFADPSVNFVLQFQPLGGEVDAVLDDLEAESEEAAGAAEPPGGGDDAKRGQVVALDAFRKKNP